MAKKEKPSQLVIRISSQLDRKIEVAASKRGLTKAAWARQLIIGALEHPSGLRDQQQARGGDNHGVTR